MMQINGSAVLIAPAAVFPKSDQEKLETLHRMSALGH
jgi:hypothetical protein